MSIMDVILDTFHWAQVQDLFGKGRKLSEDGGLDSGSIAGIIIGVVFGVVCIGALVYLYFFLPADEEATRARRMGASVSATYNFPLGKNTGAELRPLLGVFPSKSGSNDNWVIGLSMLLTISVIAAIAVGASLAEGGHGDAEGALVGVLVAFSVLAGLAAVSLGLFVWNGMRKA